MVGLFVNGTKIIPLKWIDLQQNNKRHPGNADAATKRISTRKQKGKGKVQ